VNKDVQFF